MCICLALNSLVVTACADPESFVREVHFLVYERRDAPNTTISGPSSGPPSKRHLNGVSMAGPMMAQH